MRRQISIPTIVGLLLLTVGALLGVLGIEQGRTWFLRAEPGEQPKEARVTNISDNSFTVSWITDTAVRGFIKFGEEGGSLADVASDERDNEGEQGEYETHYVNVDGLKAGSNYEFKIGSGKRLYDNSGSAFKITTGPLVQAEVGLADVVSGAVIDAETREAAAGVIVYFATERLTPQSTLTTSSGTFALTLNGVKTADLQGVYTGPAEDETFELLVEGASRGRAQGTVNMKNRDRIPPIDLPGNFDYTTPLPRDEAGIIIFPEVTSAASPSASAQGVSPTPAESKFIFENLPQATSAAEVTVLYPTALETIDVTNPEFHGQAPPRETLTITVESTPQTERVVVDSQGNWQWTPPTSLTPGEHTLTISYVDSEGILQKIVRKFTVTATAVYAADPSADSASSLQAGSAQGELEFTASPSATIVPTATRTPTLAPTIGAGSPTLTRTPTPTATATPTAMPTIARAALPATESGIPVSGNFEVTLILLSLGMVLVGAGVVVLKKSI